jgi:hypothetical protein
MIQIFPRRFLYGIAALALPAMAASASTPPVPSLSKDFHIEVDLNPRLSLGYGPGGVLNNWISFTTGVWTAPWGSGTVEVCISRVGSYQDERALI